MGFLVIGLYSLRHFYFIKINIPYTFCGMADYDFDDLHFIWKYFDECKAEKETNLNYTSSLAMSF